MRCDECGSDEITEDTFRNRPRYTCRCGHTWKEGHSKAESTCWNCGNYQHPASYTKYRQRLNGCWYCGEKRRKEDE